MNDAIAAAEARVYKPFHVQIHLHGFYVGHHYDGGANGNTGEFYLVSLVTDGLIIVKVGSDDVQPGGPPRGMWEKVGAKEWRTTGSLLLWGGSDHAANPPRAITLDLRIIESDDGSLAQQMLADFGANAKMMIRAYAASLGAGAPAVEAAQELLLDYASALLGKLAEDDVAVSGPYGLSGTIENYKVGRFVRIPGNKGSYAVISVVPDRPQSKNDWLMRPISNLMGKGINKAEVPPLDLHSASRRLVSVFARRTTPSMLPVPPGMNLKVIIEAAGVHEVLVPTNVPKVLNVTVPAGNDDIRVSVTGIGSVDVGVLATAEGPSGARVVNGYD